MFSLQRKAYQQAQVLFPLAHRRYFYDVIEAVYYIPAETGSCGVDVFVCSRDEKTGGWYLIRHAARLYLALVHIGQQPCLTDRVHVVDLIEEYRFAAVSNEHAWYVL